MKARHLTYVFALSTVAAVGCGRASADQAAEAAADSARAEGAAPAEVARRAEVARTTVAAKESAPRTRTRTIAAGTPLSLTAVTDITSRTDHAGDAFVARTTGAALASNGDTVIPAGAELVGRVTVLNSAGSPGGGGQLQVAFDSVRFNGTTRPIAVRVTSLGTRQVARGVTVEDAAKVGVGAAAGAVAGRVIGGNRTGAAAGAVVGGAAGAVYANRTKDHDIVLSPGSAVEVVLTDSFSRPVAVR
jgi:hypothetical protein